MPLVALSRRDDDPGQYRIRVPSAGDETIFGDILQSLARDARPAIAVLQTLDGLARVPFADLDPQRRDTIAARLRQTGGGALAYLTRIILQCYYRDDRVMRSLGMEPRPPHPKGFEVERRLVPAGSGTRPPKALSRRELTEIGCRRSRGARTAPFSVMTGAGVPGLIEVFCTIGTIIVLTACRAYRALGSRPNKASRNRSA
jgi:hypothetical protein